MNILIMSDTHFRQSFSIPEPLAEKMAMSDMIIHCGDFTSIEFYRFLKTAKDLRAVRGNNDRELSDILPAELSFTVFGKKITVVHGHLISIASLHMRYADSDIIVYGHTHHPSVEKPDGKLIINPGSLTMNRYVNKNSFMTLELKENGSADIKTHYINTGGV